MTEINLMSHSWVIQPSISSNDSNENNYLSCVNTSHHAKLTHPDWATINDTGVKKILFQKKDGENVTRQHAFNIINKLKKITSIKNVGNEDTQKFILFEVLKDKRMLPISKPVMTEFFENHEWQNQYSDSSNSIDSVIAQRGMKNIKQITQKILDKKGKKNNNKEQ